MKLINLTRKTTISDNIKVATGSLDRMLGLLSSKNPRCLIFYTRFGIHTFGLGHWIDVLVLNKSFRVVKMKQGLRPNRFFFWNPRYRVVVELPKGSIQRSRTRCGDQIKF